MSTDLQDFLRSRRSIRRFVQTPIEPAVIERILETAAHAPSAHNRQPWRFAVLQNDGPKKRLADLLARDFYADLVQDNLSEEELSDRIERSKTRIQAAPLIIVLCLDMSEMDTYPDEKRAGAEREMAVQSTAAAGLLLQLAASAEGLGSVWTCSPLFAPLTVQQALDLPQTWEAQAMFFIGYPQGEPKPKTRKHLENLVIYVA